jgi:cytochrome c553
MTISKYVLSLLSGLSLPFVAIGGDIANGKTLAEKNGCVACHGADFNKTIDINTPKLAGQYPDYLYAALKAYQAKGKRVVGRDNPVMSTVVGSLTPKDMQDIAAYIGHLPGSIKTVEPSGFK